MAIVPAACTAGAAGTSSASSGSQMVSVTPAIKAEIRRQGHDPDEEICKREEQMGSTIPRRICATRAEWAAKTQASKDGTRDIQNNALRTPDPNAG
ncbi:hypothetical protein D1222_01550 [Henriciella algicola]|uniref:Uncharacterized protein n=2 Tax=Henriciella algicola TaxID=1608422 RepID=A0A399RJY6_9PROT|nr:hypothetical protein D1222_01550 [Henriciella algicola]|tara:strand:- start:195 stop:482 length:288 start_codon:yes stop_codon:yes gene_type:complete